uniref:HIPK3 n=1 Tax=Echinostoma caproni TaxID=27848 RepID=A0A183BA32_9TREM
LHRLQPGAGRPVSDVDFSVDHVHSPQVSCLSFHSTAPSRPATANGVHPVQSPSCNLTVEAALTGKINCTATSDIVALTDPVPDLNLVNLGLIQHHPDEIIPISSSLLASNSFSSVPVCRLLQPPLTDVGSAEMWPFNSAHPPPSSNATGHPLWPWSITQTGASRTLHPGLAVNSGVMWPEFTLDGWNNSCSGGTTATGSANPVEVMRTEVCLHFWQLFVCILTGSIPQERARRNNVFLYIKIPGFPICLSYKIQLRNISSSTQQLCHMIGSDGILACDG